MQIDFSEVFRTDNWCSLHEFQGKWLFQSSNSHDQCYNRVRIQRFSELKRVLSELRISDFTEIYWTSLNTYENFWTLLKMSENHWISMKISDHFWKSLNIAENLWKSFKITENVWELLRTSMKNYGHLWKCLNITENSWKLLSQLWNGLKTSVGALQYRMVFDLRFVDFLWTTTFKKNPKEL